MFLFLPNSVYECLDFIIMINFFNNHYRPESYQEIYMKTGVVYDLSFPTK